MIHRVAPCRAGAGNIRRRAFTLIELLVVIAVLGILASLLLPTISGAKDKAQGMVCLNNLRQLMIGTLLYVDDHEDVFPYNLGADETLRSINDKTYLNWVNNVMSWELDSANTNASLLTVGGIAPYLGGSTRLYKCPKDRALSDLQREAGWEERTRSVSMNAMIGDAGHYTEYGTNVNNPYYRQFFKLTQVPDPSLIFVLIEEHPDSINDAYFLSNPYSHEWTDLPASYHNGGCYIAFADGHVEYHKWLRSSTKPPARPDAFDTPLYIPAHDRADYDWLMSRTSVQQGRPAYSGY